MRKEAAAKINSNEALQIELSELRVKNQSLNNRLAAADAVDADVNKIKRVLHESKNDWSFKVSNLQRQLADARESANCHRDEAFSNNDTNEQKLRKLQTDLDLACFEKQLISEEVCELRRLLIHADFGSETNIRYGSDVQRQRNLTQDRVKQILDKEAAKVSARYCKDVAQVETVKQVYLKGNDDELKALQCAAPNCSLRISTPIQHEQASSIYPNPRIKLCDLPINMVVQPLSVIDKDEGSHHSLDTCLTWETVNAIGCERNEMNHNEVLIAEQREFPKLTLKKEIAEELNRPKSHSNLPPEEGDEEYGSDFEVESTRDCSKVDS